MHNRFPVKNTAIFFCTLLFCLPIWSFQGFGGKAGIGGKAGFGGGVSGGGATTVTWTNAFCNISGGAANETCTIGNGTLSNGNAVILGMFLFSTTDTILGVCDGTGTNGCTGSSTYTIQPVYINGANFESYVIYTCNYQGTNGGVVNVHQSGTGGMYGGVVVATGNSTSSCSDGYNKAQSTSAGTAYQSGTITTTNAHDLLVAVGTNNSGASGFTNGTDGQGNTYTTGAATANVAYVGVLAESATNTYYGSVTGPSSPWNMEVIGIK